MKIRNMLVVLACVFLLFGTWLMSFNLSSANVRLANTAMSSTSTIYVDGNNAGGLQDGSSLHPWSTIQEGIDNASTGDTVFVRPYHYFETVTIPVSVNLVGESSDNTIIDGLNNPTSGVIVSIEQGVSSVSISNLTIENTRASPHYGIELTGDNNQVEISGDNISGSDYGIQIEPNSQDVTITQNDILVLSTGEGIAAGVYFANNNDNNVNISGNIITGMGPNAYGVYGYGENTTVLDNDLSDMYHGIDVAGSTEVIGNTETNVTYNINAFVPVAVAIVAVCINSIFENNIINGNLAIGPSGIYADYPENNTFSNNIVEGCQYGLYLDNTADTSYVANDTVVGNEFQNCGTGVYIAENLTYNYVYHNNFINNTVQADDEGYNNVWTSYPCGGNYWSDYSGTDNYWGEKQDIPGKDMIGDTPYTTGNVSDTYPLMNPWPMSNFWCSEDFSVAAITSSRITNFGLDNNTGISFNVNATGTNGNCAMIIPDSLLEGAFNLFVDNVPTVCSIAWSNQYHMINFTYSPGYHYVRITAEFVNKGTTMSPATALSKLGDLNGDGKVSLADLVILAEHYGWVQNSTYIGPGP